MRAMLDPMSTSEAIHAQPLHPFGGPLATFASCVHPDPPDVVPARQLLETCRRNVHFNTMYYIKVIASAALRVIRKVHLVCNCKTMHASCNRNQTHDIVQCSDLTPDHNNQ